MGDVELTSRRGVRSRAYDALPQQDRGLLSSLPPSYNQNPPRDSKNSYAQSISASESIPDIIVSREPANKLPPKYYMQSSFQKRVWKHVGLASAFILGIGLPLSLFTPVLMTYYSGTKFSSQGTACTELDIQGFFYTFSITDIFNIDLRYGDLSFGMAKFIDLVWDIFISRGGQIMLGWITYRVHSAALMRIMEDQLVSYDLYATMTLSWATIWALRPLAKTFFTRIGFRRKLLLFWVAISIIWVAFWPTITNALSGYVAKNNTLVRLEDDTGYANFTEIVTNDNLAFQFYSFYTDPTNNTRATNWTGPLLLETGPNVTLWKILQQAVLEYPFSTTEIYNTSVPYLEIAEPVDVLDGSYPYYTPCFISYYFHNQTYDYIWFQNPENVQCVANGNYQWGFSTGVFLFFIFLNAFWVIGTYGVWIHMNKMSELCRKHRSLGKYRAAVDMVEAITADLGTDICAYSDYDLERILDRRPGIKYTVAHGKANGLAHIGLSSENDGQKLRLNFGELYGSLGESSQR